MSDDDIARLHQQVAALTIQVTALREEIKKTKEDNNNIRQQTQSTYSKPANEDINNTSPIRHTLIQPGDRIRILNKVNKPTSWNPNTFWDSTVAKTGTVTAVTTNRIYFTTDNGVHTWRSRRNIIKQTAP
jgi:hypothetical protein